MALDPALHLGVYTLLLGCRTLLVNDDAGILCTSHRGRVLALRSGRDHSWHLVPRCLVLRGLSLFSMRRAAHKTPIAAPWRLTTRSTRTPTGGATRLGGRRLPWFVRAHVEFASRFAFSSAAASRIAARAFSRGASFAPMATSSRASSAARRRVFHPSWLTVTFGLSSRHRNLRRSASRVRGRSWLTAAELA